MNQAHCGIRTVGDKERFEVKNLLTVYASDGITRYNTRFTTAALTKSLWDICKAGLPMCLSHDLSRLIGWNRPTFMYLEPGMSRLGGFTQIAETKEASKEIHELSNEYLYKKLVIEPEADLEVLRQIIAPHIQERAEPFCMECVTLVEPGLARRVFVDIFSRKDKDGLVKMDWLSPMGPGVYRVGELLLFAHPFFRRSLFRLNNPNDGFLRQLQGIKDPKMTAKILLDPDMVGLASTYQDAQYEFEYWWGPKFDDDVTTITPGVAYHKASEEQTHYYSISGTEFWWQSRDKQHILEVEELRDEPNLRITEPKYGCRYVHSIVEEQTGHIFHLDGAIRAYTETEMFERLGNGIIKAGRHTEYTKLWRIDGEIETPLWKSLIAEFYRDNHLVGEYLNPDALADQSGAAPPQDQRHSRSVLQSLVPYTMQDGSGPRIGLTYYPPLEEDSTARRRVMATQTIEIEGRHILFVDGYVIELKKALERAGHKLSLSTNIALLKFEDMYADLPTIHHDKEGLQESLLATIGTVRTLIAAWDSQPHRRVVSFSVGYPVGDREAVIAILGTTADLMACFDEVFANVPLTEEAIPTWTEKVYDLITERYPQSSDVPHITGVITPSSLVAIRRRQILDVDYREEFSEEDKGLFYTLGIPQEKQELQQAVQTGEITVAVGNILTDTTCSRCHQSYLSCPCSTLLDDDVVQIMDGDLKARFPFWTDHRA